MADLILHVWDGDAVRETYTVPLHTLSTGVCEDALDLVDAESLAELDIDSQASARFLRSVVRSFRTMYPLMARIFPALTEEDFRDHTRPAEVGAVVMGVVAYTMRSLVSLGGDGSKNRRRRRKLFINPFLRYSSPCATVSGCLPTT